MNQHEIFVSYAWKRESEALVDRLCQSFAAKGYKILRDKSAMTYKDSIKSFMDSIGRGKFIMAVVSDKYMKSEYCMYEAYRMFQSPAFRERVFPIVLPDADIFSMRGQVAYLRYWQTEYGNLEAEYKLVASSSPTMVAPLTERLRDIEVTTRFINDFMAAVSDMNVLTSQIHLESNFSQLISKIEDRMKDTETKQEAKMSDDGKIEAGGGAYVGGNVNTGGGDFVGRDKHVHGNETNISIGGSVNGSSIVVGNNNNVTTGTTSTQNIFNSVYDAIDRSSRPAQDKEDLKAEVKEIETTVGQNSLIDETWLARRLRNLKRMAPDIAEIALSALAGPGVAVATIVKKVAEKVKAEA
jgi:hypothetical protein